MSLDLLTSSPVLLAAGPLGQNLIWTAVIGLLAGVVAKFLSGDREPTGCIVTMLIGIVGAYVALFLGRALNIYGENQAPGFIGSVIGAIILLVIYHFITRRTGGPKI